jgi:hypothetical protein
MKDYCKAVGSYVGSNLHTRRHMLNSQRDAEPTVLLCKS